MSIHSNRVLQQDYVYPRQIDFRVIIDDIVKSGFSYFEISRQLGITWGGLSAWRKGAEPRYSMGAGLLMMHAKQCGTELTRQRVLESEP